MLNIVDRKFLKELIFVFVISGSIFFIFWVLRFDSIEREEFPVEFIKSFLYLLIPLNILSVFSIEKFYFKVSWVFSKAVISFVFNIFGLIAGYIVCYAIEKIDITIYNFDLALIFFVFGIPLIVILFSTYGYRLRKE